jgi:hypothetical protein
MKLGIVIPSRLQPRPGGRFLEEYGPELWLDGALASAVRQLGCTCCSKVFVGADPEAFVPRHVFNHAAVVRAPKPGQAAAVNVAVAAALGWDADTLLFLEDDDRWLGSKTKVQLPYLRDFDFVSCSQLLVNEAGEGVGVNDYPTPSGWCMRAATWEKVGPFDEDQKWLVDTGWLGKLCQSKLRRAHLVRAGEVHSPNKLAMVSRFSEVIPCKESVFLVERTINTAGGMATIFGSEAEQKLADGEGEAMRKRFGFDPW